jgi:hypothetical protein
MPASRVLVVLASNSWGIGGLGTAVAVTLGDGVAEARGVVAAGIVGVVVTGFEAVGVVAAGVVTFGVVAAGVVAVGVEELEQPAADKIRDKAKITEKKTRESFARWVLLNVNMVLL